MKFTAVGYFLHYNTTSIQSNLLQSDLADAVVGDAQSLLVLLNVLEHSGPAQAALWQLVGHKPLGDKQKHTVEQRKRTVLK